MTFKKSLIGGACLSLQPLALNALSVPAMAFIIRGLGPTAYGQWTMATAITSALAILTNLGLRGAFVRQITAKPENAATALSEQLGLRLMLSAGAGLLSISICLALGYPALVTTCAAVCAVSMLITTFATTLVDLLQSTHRLTTVAAVNLIAGLMLTAVSVIVVWMQMGPVAVSLAYCVGPLVSAVLLVTVVRTKVHFGIRFDLSGARQLLWRSRSFTAQQLLNGATIYAEALLLPRLIGVTGFGFFAAGTLLSTRLAVIPDGLCTAAYPLLTQRFHNSRRGGAQLTLYYLGIVLAVCLPIAILAALFAGPIAGILFPDQPEICRAVILITIWALPLLGIEAVLGYAINAAGADTAQARASLPAAVCNIVLTILLMGRLGILGACIAIPLRNVVRIAILIACFARCVWTEAQADVIAPATFAT